MENRSREALLLEMQYANAAQPEFINPEDTYTTNPDDIEKEEYEVEYYELDDIEAFGTRLKSAYRTLRDWIK